MFLMLFLLKDLSLTKAVMLSEAKHLAAIANEARSFAKTLRMTPKEGEMV